MLIDELWCRKREEGSEAKKGGSHGDILLGLHHVYMDIKGNMFIDSVLFLPPRHNCEFGCLFGQNRKPQVYVVRTFPKEDRNMLGVYIEPEKGVKTSPHHNSRVWFAYATASTA